MTPTEVLRVVEPLTREVFSEAVEAVEIREDDDWSGTPALYIDVFLAHGTLVPDYDAWLKARLELSDRLVKSGEIRVPYVRLRDRKEEEQEAPDRAA